MRCVCQVLRHGFSDQVYFLASSKRGVSGEGGGAKPVRTSAEFSIAAEQRLSTMSLLLSFSCNRTYNNNRRNWLKN